MTAEDRADRPERVQPRHSKCAIVMACDEGYAAQLATMLRSMAEANRSGRPLDVYVMTADFAPQVKQKVIGSLPEKHSTRVIWVSIEVSPFQEFTTRPYISKMTYARLLLPEILDHTISRALYLDADMLVLDDLEALWNTDLEGAPVGAIIDSDSESHVARLWQNATDDRERGSISARDYFNAGMLLIDVAHWREEGISEKALWFMKMHPDTLLADQDALNVACCGLWKRLDPRWNCQVHDRRGYANTPPDELPGVVHFAGKWKPWNAKSLSPDMGFYDVFRSRTKFARTPAEKLRDSALRAWMYSKRALKRYRSISIIYYRVKPVALRLSSAVKSLKRSVRLRAAQ